MSLIKSKEEAIEILEDVLYILEEDVYEETTNARACAYLRSKLGYPISVAVDGIVWPGEAERDYEQALERVKERRESE